MKKTLQANTVHDKPFHSIAVPLCTNNNQVGHFLWYYNCKKHEQVEPYSPLRLILIRDLELIGITLNCCL